jgi:hypothetical protein
MDGFVVAQTVDERNKDAMQKRVFAGQCAAGCDGFCIAENSGAHANRRANHPTAERGWCNGDNGVVANALHFPRGIPIYRVYP